MSRGPTPDRCVKGKSKTVLLTKKHTIKTYGGEGRDLHIFNLGTKWRWGQLQVPL